MKKVYYFPQFKSYGINVSDLEKTLGDVPLIVLSCMDYHSLGHEFPASDAPVVGVLFPNKQKKRYLVDEDYVKSLISTGVRILFLDYENFSLKLELCDALVIAGDSVVIPEKYYTDAKNINIGIDNKTKSFIECYKTALKCDKPVLGIDAGMQIIAAEAGLKLFRSQDYFESPYSHTTGEKIAHHIDLVEKTPFRKLMDDKWRLPVNSRHYKALAPIRVQRELLNTDKLPLEFYAFASDGIPEAVGKMEKGVLGVQWHPENYAVAGNKMQQLIFNWIAEKALEYRNLKRTKRSPL